MKKLISVIPIAAMFGILAFFFVYMCLPQNPGTTTAVYTVDLNFIRTRGLYCVGVGVILMAALYHLTLYILRPREMGYLIFSLWCMQLVVHFVFAQDGFNGFFEWIPAGPLFTWLDNLSFFLRHYNICIFALYLFARQFLLSHKTICILYLVLGVSFFSLAPSNTPFFMLFASVVVIAVSLFASVIAFWFPTWKENLWSLFSFTAFTLHTFGGIVGILIIPDKYFMLKLIFNIFLILSQSFLLAKTYTNAFILVEETNENLERIVDDRTKDLQHTNSAMKELVGNISHDLKTPLAVMSVNLEELLSLSETQGDEELERHVRIAYQKNLDLQRLIQNLIEISRIETGQNVLSPEWVSLLDVLEMAQDKYDDFLRSNDIFFEIYCTENAEIYIDPQRIWNVFNNIIYNAAKHTEAGGTITINATVLKEEVVVTIIDTGCGIDVEHLPYVFERFYKANASRGGSGSDSGLGLYIVKTVMEALGGSVAAKSESGKGTSIILSFVKKREQ